MLPQSSMSVRLTTSENFGLLSSSSSTCCGNAGACWRLGDLIAGIGRPRIVWDIVPGDYNDWIVFSLVWFPVGSIALYMTVHKIRRAFMDPCVQAVVKLSTVVAHRFCDTFKSSTYGSLRDLVKCLMQFSLNLIVAVVSTAFWKFVLLIPASRYLGPFQSLLSLTWNACDVGTAGASIAQDFCGKP